MSQPTSLALVTGGSRGLGRSVALHLARSGVDVIVTYRGAEPEARGVVRELEALGRKAAALQLDVGRDEDLPGFVEALRAVLRQTWDRERLELLVNNAGIGLHAPFAGTTGPQLDELYRVHLKGPYLLTQALLPLLADGARVLNVSTGLARFTLPGYSAYAAMKGAVEVLTRYQAAELATRGIAVNVVAPGATVTDFGGGALRASPELQRRVASMVAMGRVGQPEDIGAAVAALLAPGLHWMTGQRVELSGGQLL